MRRTTLQPVAARFLSFLGDVRRAPFAGCARPGDRILTDPLKQGRAWRRLGKTGQNYLLALLCMIICLPLTACKAGLGGPEPNTLRINIGGEPPGLDWDTISDSTSFDVISNLMVGLTQYTNDLRCVPGMAERWEILDGGKRYLFHLRHNAYWTDGKPVIAPDFEYAWKRLLDPKTGATYAYFFYDVINAFEFNTGKLHDASTVGVKALDDYTLDVHLKRPAAYFIFLTAFGPSYPARKDVIERWGDRWSEPEHIVTNGPFTLSKWQHEYKIEVISNPRFFAGEPRLKKIKMFMVPEQSTAFALYENDQLDYVDNRSFSTPDVERFQHSPEYRNIPLLRNNYLGFNITKRPFDDIRVRRAVTMAINRDVFPKILRRHEQPAYTWIPPALAGYSPESKAEFDPQAARQLLAKAGYPDGQGFPTVYLLFPSREDVQLVVEAIQDELKRNLGISIQLQNEEWKVYLEHLHRDAPPIFRNSWGADYPDPETFANLFTSHSGNNDTRWSSPQYDQLIAKAEGEQDPKLRAQLYAQCDRMLCREQVPIVPTYLSTQNVMVKPWVRDMQFNALDNIFLKDVWIDANWQR